MTAFLLATEAARWLIAAACITMAVEAGIL